MGIDIRYFKEKPRNQDGDPNKEAKLRRPFAK